MKADPGPLRSRERHIGLSVRGHWPDPSVPFEETAGHLRELVEAGKVRHVGVSNFDVAQMDAFSRTCPVDHAPAALSPVDAVLAHGRGRRRAAPEMV
jgi:aryl-alcohol dehydrogenase-like predicted oxidoreductase